MSSHSKKGVMENLRAYLKVQQNPFNEDSLRLRKRCQNRCSVSCQLAHGSRYFLLPGQEQADRLLYIVV